MFSGWSCLYVVLFGFLFRAGTTVLPGRSSTLCMLLCRKLFVMISRCWKWPCCAVSMWPCRLDHCTYLSHTASAFRCSASTLYLGHHCTCPSLSLCSTPFLNVQIHCMRWSQRAMMSFAAHSFAGSPIWFCLR
jgi:hypothetical protein